MYKNNDIRCNVVLLCVENPLLNRHLQSAKSQSQRNKTMCDSTRFWNAATWLAFSSVTHSVVNKNPKSQEKKKKKAEENEIEEEEEGGWRRSRCFSWAVEVLAATFFNTSSLVDRFTPKWSLFAFSRSLINNLMLFVIMYGLWILITASGSSYLDFPISVLNDSNW